MKSIAELIEEKEKLARRKKEVEDEIKKIKEREKGYEFGTFKISLADHQGKYGYKLTAKEMTERPNTSYKVLAFSPSKEEMLEMINEIIDAMTYFKKHIEGEP